MSIDKTIRLKGWFEEPGAYVLVDGQFGSTGKGLMAGWLAEYGNERISHVTTNAGPNSGHTAYFDKGPHFDDDRYVQVLTQQLPVASVFLKLMGEDAVTVLNGGAVIDEDILRREVTMWGFHSRNTYIHPAAAVITEDDREEDRKITNKIAGTGKGIGPAMAKKLMRLGEGRYAGDLYRPLTMPKGMHAHVTPDWLFDFNKDRVLVETAQGYSLGVHSARFFPHTTSRECTVAQAIADARIPAQEVKKVIACFRTYPIRVGNTAGSSGGHYEDQQEIRWEDIGQPPELTTVTKRVRRLFTWSRTQFRECVAANRPDVIFLNFCNYLTIDQVNKLIDDINEDYFYIMGKRAPTILCGHGPNSADISWVQ